MLAESRDSVTVPHGGAELQPRYNLTANYCYFCCKIPSMLRHWVISPAVSLSAREKHLHGLRYCGSFAPENIGGIKQKRIKCTSITIIYFSMFLSSILSFTRCTRYQSKKQH